MKYLELILATMLVATLSSEVFAVPVENLFDARRLVAGQGQGDRKPAVQEGLEEVIVRIAGSDLVVLHPSIQKALLHAESYLTQFAYQTTEETISQGNKEILGTVLSMSFDAVAIQKLLLEAGQAYWGENRPGVLLWCLVEGDSIKGVDGETVFLQPYILSAESGGAMGEQIRAQMNRRGLPFNFPSMDSIDQHLINPQVLREGVTDKVLAASKKYKSETFVYGKITLLDTDEWRGNWKLSVGDWETRYEASSNELTVMLASMVDGIANYLGREYATRANLQNGIVIKVEGVDSLAVFKHLEQYLETVDNIKKFQLARAAGASLWFILELNGESDQFLQTVALGKSLLFVDKLEPDEVRTTQQLNFVWGGKQ